MNRRDRTWLLRSFLQSPGNGGSDPEASYAFLASLSEEDRKEILVEVLTVLPKQAATIQELGEKGAEYKKLLDTLTADPWVQADFLMTIASSDGPKALVRHGHSRTTASFGEGMDPASFETGDCVFLTNQLSTIMERVDPDIVRWGDVAECTGTTSDGRILVSVGGRELPLLRARPLKGVEIKEGARIRYYDGIAYEVMPPPGRDGLFLSEAERPTTSFEEVGGLAEPKKRIIRFFTRFIFEPEKTRLYGLEKKGSIHFYGAPGGGKTMLMQATYNFLNQLDGWHCKLMCVDPGTLLSPYFAESEHLIGRAFAAARAEAEADEHLIVLIWMDEVDSLVRARGDRFNTVSERVMGRLLTELDGLRRRNERVICMSATNRVDLIDIAAARGGRLGDEMIEVPRPNTATAVADIFGKYLKESMLYAEEEGGRGEIIETVSSFLCAEGERNTYARAVLRDGTRHEVTALDLVSGSAIHNIAKTAKERAFDRDVAGGSRGIRASDVLISAVNEMRQIAGTLSPANIRDYKKDLPAGDVVRVEPVTRKAACPHRFLSVA